MKKMYLWGFKFKIKIMTVVSTKQFNTNQKRYFELAENEEVCIKRGNSMYHLMYRPLEKQYPEQPILAPDDDLRSAITIDEFLVGVREDIHNYFSSRGKICITQ